MAKSKRSGRDRRLSLHFATEGAERRAYSDRRGEPERMQAPVDFETQQIPTVGTQTGPTARTRNVAIAVLILAAVLLVSL